MHAVIHRCVELIRGLPNRGSQHCFLGHPLSDGCDKTTVEPGNGYSPGVWTCGVRIAVVNDTGITTPDALHTDELSWGFDKSESFVPVLAARYTAGSMAVTHRLSHIGGEGAEGIDYNEVVVNRNGSSVMIVVALTDIGPAGGKIESLQWDEKCGVLTVNSSIKLSAEGGFDECEIIPAHEPFDSPMALCVRHFPAGSDPAVLRFTTAHNYLNRFFGSEMPRVNLVLPVRDAFEQVCRGWVDEVPARVFCPDGRVVRAWDGCAFHLLSAMECGHPRIGAVNYPVFWMRDCVIVLRALDFLGRHDLAHIGNDYLAYTLFAGGFGAESDAPGQAVWALVSHALITQNTSWLAEVFPTIRKRLELLDRMRTTTRPLHALSENRVHNMINTPGSTVLALPSCNGLIHGRMDGHSPDFFINCWASGGYRFAALAAQVLGQQSLACQWRETANQLDELISTHLLPDYGNDRDPIIAPYPSGALAGHTDALKSKFSGSFRSRRIDKNSGRIRERLWTYFETASIHNAFLLGERENAWTCIDGMLNDDPSCIFGEGEPGNGECLPFRNGEERRGWLRADKALYGNMPHNWTTAEMVTCIRDMFIREEQGGLVFGTGVPLHWKVPGARFGVHAMPTDYGPVSYTATIDTTGTVSITTDAPVAWRADV